MKINQSKHTVGDTVVYGRYQCEYVAPEKSSAQVCYEYNNGQYHHQIRKLYVWGNNFHRKGTELSQSAIKKIASYRLKMHLTVLPIVK